MRVQVSVNKAIKRGHLMVNVPVVLTIIGCPALAIYLSDKNSIPKWSIGVAFLIGFILAWLIWSYMITKWRIWAFANVQNVHELKKRAIQEKLIWDDGNVFERTEIKSNNDKKELKKLNKKFEKEDTYREDYSLPPKKEIYFSKATIFVELGVAIFIVIVGIYYLLKGEIKFIILGSILFSIGLYTIIKESKKAFNFKPQIIIDNKGITTVNVSFKDWETIEGEEIIQEGYGKSSKSYLTYFYDEDGFEKIEIELLNVTHSEMENIIRTYRIRNTKNFR
jgi:hypothetical protein